jgi:CBS domain-containing protein
LAARFLHALPKTEELVMRCEELMRRPVESCRATDNVHAAARAMRDANIGFLPVCDEAERVIGVVTDRDLAMRVLAAERDLATTTIGDVMSREVVSCRPQDDVRQAQRLMAQHKKSRVVVTDPRGRLLGVISLADAATVDSLLAADTLSRVAGREVLDSQGHVTHPQ